MLTFHAHDCRVPGFLLLASHCTWLRVFPSANPAARLWLGINFLCFASHACTCLVVALFHPPCPSSRHSQQGGLVVGAPSQDEDDDDVEMEQNTMDAYAGQYLHTYLPDQAFFFFDWQIADTRAALRFCKQTSPRAPPPPGMGYR